MKSLEYRNACYCLWLAAALGIACSCGRSSDTGGPDGNPELGEDAGVFVMDDFIPRRSGGAPALITDEVYGPEYAAAVSFDASQVGGRDIPSGIGSINLEVQFNGFNLVDETATLRQSVVDRLQRLNLASKTLRWPGGGYDELDYQKCLGPVGAREPQTIFGTPQVVSFGPQEASQLAGELGSELWMQVQPMLVPGVDGSEEAAAHGAVPVYQHNSGDSGTIDRRVVNWQIGNEQYHYDSQEYSVEDFIGAAGQMIPVMKQEDPDIHVWVPVQENYSNNYFSSQPNWTSEVLKELAGDIHGLTIHDGYAPVVPSARSSSEVAAAYRAMFSNSRWAFENLQAIDTLIDTWAPGHAGRLRYAITEANAIFGVLPSDHNLMNHTQTLASAAYVASMLAAYTRHPRVDYVHLFTGVQFTTQGLVGVTDGSFVTPPDTLSSVGVMLHLWNQWAKGKILTEVAVETGTFASASLGWMAARNDNPLLDVLVRADGGELGILLVNRSLDKSARVSLNIANHSPSHLLARGLLGRAPDSNPGLTIPEIVSPIESAVLERWNLGGQGEIWVRTEELASPAGWPSIRVPRSSVVFITAQP